MAEARSCRLRRDAIAAAGVAARVATLLVPVAAALAVGAAASQDRPPTDTRRPAAAFMGPALQALQRDDASNPAMLWVAEGAALWQREDGAARRSCASCHGDAAASMRGVAARHPSIDATSGRAVALADRIALCRERHQRAAPLPREDAGALGLEAHVALQSRGLPVTPPIDPRLDAVRTEGERLWKTPYGQLGLACTQCHDANAGRRLAGSAVPEAHPTGYPLYRVEWQGVGSFARRVRGCLTGVRAEPFPDGAPEVVALEAHLKARAAGMAMDAPAVRP